MTVLGLSCWYHDSAAAIVRDGVIVAAAQEERFSRRKHDPEFPAQAVAFCLERAGIAAADLDAVAFYDKPLLKFERLLETCAHARAARPARRSSRRCRRGCKQKLWIGDRIADALGDAGRADSSSPSTTRATRPPPSSRRPSSAPPFSRPTASASGRRPRGASGTADTLDIRAELHFPHSLGLLYSAFTYFCGFRVNSGEYKLMGLAPVRPAGLPRPDPRAPRRPQARRLVPPRPALLHLRRRAADDGPRLRRPLRRAGARARVAAHGARDGPRGVRAGRHRGDRAARWRGHVHAETGEANLCLAGGVALNCVANGRLLREGPFREIWIQPAAGDAGGALGAALDGDARLGRTPRGRSNPSDAMQGARLGPEFSRGRDRDRVRRRGLSRRRRRDVRDGRRPRRPRRRPARRRPDGRLVPGPRRVRPSRPRRPLDPRRPARPRRAAPRQRAGEVPRELPALRPGRAVRTGRRRFSIWAATTGHEVPSSAGPPPPARPSPVHAARRARARRRGARPGAARRPSPGATTWRARCQP